MIRRIAVPVGWVTGLVIAVALLRAAAVGDLSAPPVRSPGSIGDWADNRSAGASAVALVRLGAEVFLWYLLALSALHVAATTVRPATGHRIAHALALPAARRLLHAGLGLGMAASTTLASTGDDAVTGTATMAPVAPDEPEPGGGTAVMVPLDQPTDATAVMAPASPAVTDPTTVTVVPGDSLWSIAEDTLAGAWGRSPSTTEIDPYWRRVVDANGHRLVDHHDPDLILPGQVFELPSVPPDHA